MSLNGRSVTAHSRAERWGRGYCGEKVRMACYVDLFMVHFNYIKKNLYDSREDVPIVVWQIFKK